MEPKPGYKTTEFWMTIVTFVFGALVALGVITQDSAAEWQSLLAPLITAVLPVVIYIWGRSKVKSS